jgi:sulfate-transporting ATPase
MIHGVIGPNGAGKTTLIDAVTGFVQPRSGRVALGSVDISSWAIQRRMRAGMVRSFQGPETFADLSVADNLTVAGTSLSWYRYILGSVIPRPVRLPERAERAIEALGLADKLTSDPSTLSFGQQKMLGNARAVASGPSVLLLDEPASGLDLDEVRKLAAVVVRFAREWGISVLIVEHNMDMVLPICDIVSVLDAGRLLRRGTPDQISADSAVRAAYLGTADPQDVAV